MVNNSSDEDDLDGADNEGDASKSINDDSDNFTASKKSLIGGPSRPSSAVPESQAARLNELEENKYNFRNK